MRGFAAFFKKECIELMRSGKLVFLGIIFTLFGIMNPAIAKLTPRLMEMISETMEGIGMTITETKVTAMQCWEQFFKNIPIALLVCIILFSSSYSREYTQGTLTPLLTKGLSKAGVTAAKSLLAELVWTVGYWLCFGITYVYAAYFWDNSIAEDLFPAAVFWWMCGVWLMSALMLFGTVSDNSSTAMLGTGAVFGISYLIGIIPKCSRYVPTFLTNGMALLRSAEDPQKYAAAFCLTILLTGIFLLLAGSLGKRKIYVP